MVVRITKDNLHGNSHEIPLTKTQINRITKTKNGFNLSLSFPTATGIITSHLRRSRSGRRYSRGVAFAVSSAKNARAAASQIAEMERHNREIESQLKSGANGAGVSNGDVVGNGIISDAASRIPVVGPFIVLILKKFGLG